MNIETPKPIPPVKTGPKPIRWWVATCGDEPGSRTNCMIEVEHFSDRLAYGRAIKRAERLHMNGEIDSYTYGEILE